MNQESKRPVTIEDLLQLKRNERPPAEFWATFDRELRAKQLAALVEKRPWYRNLDFSRALRGFVRYQLPLGAAAVLTVTYVVLRDNHHAVAAPAAKAIVAAPIESPAATVTVAMISTAPSLASETMPLAAVTDDSAPAANDLTADNAATESTSATPADLPAMQADTPSARYIAANLRAAQQAEPLVARGLLAQAHGFEARGLPAKATVEPLAQMTTPASARIAKLSSAMSFSSMVDKSTRTSDRIAHRLLNDGDDRLYETASRLKVGGDRLGLKL